MTDTRVDRPQRPASSGSPDWRDHAACRDTDPELFFPVGNAGPALHQLDRAKQVCAGCPVRAPCLEWALASGQEAGVWGGTSEDERCALRRMRQASARPDIADSRRAPLPVQQKRRDQETRRYRSLGGLMDDEFIRINAMATGAACAQMTAMRLRGLHDSVEHASCLPGKSAWHRRAAAHAEIFILLARMTDDPVLAPVLLGAADDVHHLVLVAGPAANGTILSSRQRLLAYMRAGRRKWRSAGDGKAPERPALHVAPGRRQSQDGDDQGAPGGRRGPSDVCRVGTGAQHARRCRWHGKRPSTAP